MGIASHLSWSSFDFECYTIPILFALQDSGVYENVRIVHDGTCMTFIQDQDLPVYATITGTAIIPMEVGQKVSDYFKKCILVCLYVCTTKVHS